ncbi:MAG: DUF5615 family PIN-like protein [Burkholderiales bacterium]
MKLLFDQNISPSLVALLADLRKNATRIAKLEQETGAEFLILL